MAMVAGGLDSLLERDTTYMKESWSWFGIGATVILVRFMVRIRMVGIKGFAGDDYVTFLTLVMFTIDAVLVDRLYKYGTNVDVPSDVMDMLSKPEIDQLIYGSKIQLAAWYSYTALIWSMKTTMLFFFNRLTPIGLWQRQALRWLALFTALAYLAVVLTISLGCRPYDHNWQVRPLPPTNCTVKRQNFFVTAIFNVLTDAAILCIPLPMLKQLKAPLVQKILIGVLLCSGVFVITAAILRAAITLGSAPSSITINRWGVRETIIGILAINAPILRPLFRRNFWGSSSESIKRSRFDSAAFGVDTNEPGYTMTDNGSHGNVARIDEERGAALTVVPEASEDHNACGLGEPSVVILERTFDVNRTSLDQEEPEVDEQGLRIPKGTQVEVRSESRQTKTPSPSTNI